MNSTQPSATGSTRQAPQEERLIGDKMPQSQQKSFDPLEVLPEEIWVAIIAESASEMRDRAGLIISQDVLLDLMQVSRSWSVQISSSAVLWVDIMLDDEHDSAEKAALAFRYSKQAPVALYMHYPMDWWTALGACILANRVRITKLFFRYNFRVSFEGAILRRLLPLPNLATFDHSWLLGEARQDILKYVSNYPIASTNIWLDRRILEQKTMWDLRKVHLSCELEDVFDLLEGSEYLREVSVYGSGANPTLDAKNLSLQGPPLPWKSLDYRSDGSSFLGSIIGRLPRLVELRIYASQKIFCYLMPLIFQLENLSIFEVTLRGKWERFERLVIPQASTSVTEVEVRLESDIISATEPVVDALFRSLANIQRLKLHVVDVPIVRMLTSSTGFPHLNALFIYVSLQRGDTRSILSGVLESFPTSVERVSYSVHGTPLEPLIPLQSHQIKHLAIRRFTLSEVNIYSQRWPAIRTIELGSPTAVNWKGPIYQHLHTIILNEISRDNTDLGGNVTKVCRDIALHPEYFPAVSKLELETCPDLDILFILLETRNVATPLGISPISTLVIPTRCPPFLVERLRDLVKGTRHSVSSYYDLSITGNYDIMTDASITGCFACHRALRFCTMHLNTSGTRLPTTVIEYPEGVTEILESWDVRAKQWYLVEEKLRARRIYSTLGSMKYLGFGFAQLWSMVS